VDVVVMKENTNFSVMIHSFIISASTIIIN
jgi:hypothetical protein